MRDAVIETAIRVHLDHEERATEGLLPGMDHTDNQKGT